MNEIETRLLNVAYQLHEVINDIEAYLPPDDSESWGDNASDLLRTRNELESEFNQLVSEIKTQATEYAASLSEKCINAKDIGFHHRTLPEIIRDHEQSKWVKFDPNEESTWPPMSYYQDLLVATPDGTHSETAVFDGEGFRDFTHEHIPNVTHWQPLPNPPAGKDWEKI